MTQVIVPTSDKYLWTIEPFAYLFNVYWSTLQPVTVLGYKRPGFDLPENFTFVSLADEGYPAKKWSNALIEFLRSAEFDVFVLLLDDYWLSRTVDTGAVETLSNYVRGKPDILRLDLTTDRLYAGGRFDVGFWGHYDLIETPYKTPYQMSLQAGIWRRDRILEVLKPNMTPWEVEINTQPPERMRVLGTRQNPVRYVNAFKGGRLENDLIRSGFEEPHRTKILRMMP